MAKSMENSTSISPNLLKNFNPYDLLEPQKIATLQVDKLIDIDAPISSTYDYKSTHVNASLLDQKPKYDLIDLFQNMYVTPQHVKVKETNKIDDIKDDNDNLNIDYTAFFDIVESGKKIDWSKNNIEKETTNNCDTEISSNPESLNKTKLASEDSIDPDYLIDEVLAEKSLERIYFSTETLHDNINENCTLNNESLDVNEFPKIKILKAPSNIDFKSPIKNVDSHTVKCSKNKSTITIEVQTDNDLTADFVHLKSNNKNNTFIDVYTDSNILVPQPCSGKTEGKLINTDFKVIAAKKDAKALKKYYIATSESKKRNYTKGADFKEKSIVLPQIMSNIIIRQAYLEEKNNKEKKLILDFGAKMRTDYKSVEKNAAINFGINKCDFNSIFQGTSSHENGKQMNKCCNCSCKESNRTENISKDTSTFGKVSPIVLMADCNKERLKALHQTRLFRQFVMNGE